MGIEAVTTVVVYPNSLAAWFQPWSLSSEKPVSSLCFQMGQLAPLYALDGAKIGNTIKGVDAPAILKVIFDNLGIEEASKTAGQ
jgi:hypothetical protein